ncbi:serine hydrolase [Pseudomonas aeruginosa]|uniref:serine hydrolase domain-containing protein n=1 Tax=Pseudomonas aeruginosa TaxID=287 RepID=UPI001F0959E5|nr:serine hydrolase [Pseudomonas aeruginosa]MEB3081540.1 serine hydrolase [Pseudomonas aeruginosa]MEB3142996.1 serine hydrolase [Pseudomonas aeruginosa]
MVNGEPETALVGCTGAYPSTVALLLATVLALISPTSASATTPAASLESVLNQASSLAPLETVIVASNGQVIAEHGYRGHTTTAPTNIKSASKLVISALVGIAIDKGVLEGTDQPVALLLAQDLPAKPDPRLQQLTIGHLLSMQAGLGSTSGPGYGAWVGSRNWVQAALARPFEDEPGGRMIYSTGSTHLLSAILTRQSGRSTLQLARDWLGPLEGFQIAGWTQDPQGIYMGGNEMAMSPRSLLAFGELYRTGGVTPAGERLISREWIDTSWQLRTRSPWTGDGHGYAWFLTRIAGEDVRYGWGYGGQMLYLVPRLGLTVVMTSNESASSAQSGHRNDLHRLLGRIIVAAIQADHALGTASANRVSKNAWTSAHERRSASSW